MELFQEIEEELGIEVYERVGDSRYFARENENNEDLFTVFSDHGMDFIAFLGSPTGFEITLDARFDLVQCDGLPETNVPCHWGRVAGFTGPNE